MIPADVIGFAGRALLGHRVRAGLSLLGVAIGVAAVVTLTALGEGARAYVTGQFRSIGTNLLVLLPGKTETTGTFPGLGGVPNDLTLQDADAILRQVPAIQALAPVTMATETVSNGERRRQVAVIGTTHEWAVIRELVLDRGEFLPPTETARSGAAVVLGKSLARELFPGEEAVGRVVRIGSWRMRVVGVLQPKGQQFSVNLDDVAMVPVSLAMKMFNRRSLFRILMRTHAHADLLAARRDVVRVISERHGEEDVTCMTQDALLNAFSSVLGALTLALTAIATISLAVAGIGIMNVMLVSVSERTAEVGLLKAIGAGGAQILVLFLAEAALISLAGGLLGLAIGWSASRILLALYPDVPVTPPAWAVAAALAVSTAVGITFGALPAHRAARLDPVAALARR